jgi:hypothetical protein
MDCTLRGNHSKDVGFEVLPVLAAETYEFLSSTLCSPLKVG